MRRDLSAILICGLVAACFSPQPSNGDESAAGPLRAPRPATPVDPPAAPAPPAVEPFTGLKVPEGFEVTLYADDDLAHDIYTMTVDARGRVVVAGAGYVRILIDSDNDGRADKAQQFADGPKTGSMGMFFYGPDLICTGDQGLLRFQDRDGDDRADGPPDLFLKIKSGGEHDAHAIRKGPDGWWYLLSGNMANVTASYATLPTSPVKQPAAGTLMRLKPDLTGGEIVAHGLRNAYDFDFNELGDAFTFDSDGERDISLPWYRPTRVFQLTPGAECGWVTRSWKRPNEFVDMPPVVGAFGRGSPTGVVCYRHTQFPAEFRGALFVQDWTFGRVIALPMTSKGSVWESQPVDFMTAKGQFGFAPTAIAVGPDGSLYVSVGGRGTRGSVFRVRWTGSESTSPDWFTQSTPEAESDRLTYCLQAPQSLVSWSRARWMPIAEALGADPFRQAALAPERPAAERIRAIEVLTELFGGLDATTAAALAKDSAAPVRARAIWSIGRQLNSTEKLQVVATYLGDVDPLVVRAALEALLTAETVLDLTALVEPLSGVLDSRDRFVRQAAARVVSRLDMPQLAQLRTITRSHSAPGAIARELGIAWNRGVPTRGGIEIGLAVLEGEFPLEQKIEAARLIQVSLGDVGPAKDRAPVFEGYAPQQSLADLERNLDPYRVRLSTLFPTGNAELDHELLRLIAMLQPYNLDLLDKIIAGITDDSHPTDDVHRLIVAARLPLERNYQQTEAMAKALVQIDHKLKARKLKQDLNWEDRLMELYEALVKIDPVLPNIIVQQEGFGLPGHYLFLSQISADVLPQAIDGYVKQIEADPNYAWTNEVIYVLGESDQPRPHDLLREQYENLSVRNAVLAVISSQPREEDREKFVEGLSASHLAGIGASFEALTHLDLGREPGELFQVLGAVRRLSSSTEEFELRAKMMDALQQLTGQNFGFNTGPEGYGPQPEPIERCQTYLNNAYPEEAQRQLGAAGEEWSQLVELLAEAETLSGDRARGAVIFEKRACSRCHGGRQALGPDLAGVAQRFGQRDLLTAIAIPSRDVASRYRTTLVQTTGGKVYSGIIVYESVDGLILRDAENKTYRIESPDIEEQQELANSLMPAGLLKGMTAQELADLLAHLASLTR